MSVIGGIVVGLIVAASAQLVRPATTRGGIGTTMVLGVVGAVLGGVLGQWAFHHGLGDLFNLRADLLALVGSLLLLIIYLALPPPWPPIPIFHPSLGF